MLDLDATAFGRCTGPMKRYVTITFKLGLSVDSFFALSRAVRLLVT